MIGRNVIKQKCFYQVLQVDPSASQHEIKDAYLKLAKVYHPDCNRLNQGKFLELKDAYNVLGNPIFRSDYDEEIYELKVKTEKRNQVHEGLQVEDINMHQSIESIFAKGFVVVFICSTLGIIYVKKHKSE